ncbi:helix-turn-helix domain-containing protein [Algoriella sp.]|uniref:helix-turn-helix domain-containing protein n=1 Tax=Algoriella sp. TaxID=1872434 RepID=UPI002FC83D3C
MNTWVIVLIVVSCVIVLGLIYYFLTKKSNQTEQSNSLTENTTTNKTEVVRETLSNTVKIEEDKKTEALTQENIKTTTNQEIIQEEPQLSINISSKTEKILLRKLELFEKNKGFIKKDINLSSLAKQFETNTKYLSEIIKTHRQKQFNNYLNELRINYIVDRLKNEPKYINTKISYLASDCGFTSHSTFTTIFTQITNESPSIFMKKIKEERLNS